MSVELSALEITIRILVAFLASMAFGLERQFRKKPVGFGTFTFVTTGATVLVLGATLLSDSPVTIFGAIVTGIGFLGAGAIIKSGDKKVTGITTAASIWAFAALGITIGLGLYAIAAVFYVLIIAIILIDSYFETHGFGAYAKSVTITLDDPAKMREIERMLPESHKNVMYNFDTKKSEYTVSVFMSGNKREMNMTLNEMLKHPNVISVKIE
jgi:putative Mg2+ transporter-C (MgtC) family protein